MLVLSRMVGETVMIGGLCAVTVLKISPESVRLLLSAGITGLKLKTVDLARDQIMYLNPAKGSWSDDPRMGVADAVQITLVDIRDDKARIGINAPKKLDMHRLEVWEAIQKENQSRDDEGSAGARVPRPPKPNPPSLDVRLDEPKSDDDE